MTAFRWKRLALFSAGMVGIVTVIVRTTGRRVDWMVVAAAVWVLVASVLGHLGRPSDDRASGKPSV